MTGGLTVLQILLFCVAFHHCRTAKAGVEYPDRWNDLLEDTIHTNCDRPLQPLASHTRARSANRHPRYILRSAGVRSTWHVPGRHERAALVDTSEEPVRRLFLHTGQQDVYHLRTFVRRRIFYDWSVRTGH